MSEKRRCWQYLAGCRNPGTTWVRIGDHSYRYCDDPKHDPTKLRKTRRTRAGSKR